MNGRDMGAAFFPCSVFSDRRRDGHVFAVAIPVPVAGSRDHQTLRVICARERFVSGKVGTDRRRHRRRHSVRQRGSQR